MEGLNAPTGITVRELLSVVVLFFSIGGNIFQLYRQRLYSNTLYNGLVGAFNSVGWLLARCINRTRDLEARVGTGNDPTLREARDYSVETDFFLRVFHEQLAALEKTLRRRDRRWQAGEFRYSPDEVERMRRAFSDRLGAPGGRAGEPE